MTIGIMQCGVVPEPLQEQFGAYAGMMQRMLGTGRRTEVYDVTAGEWPESGACETYLLTGASVGVYDDLPWVPNLLAFLRQVRGQSKLVGICFGHQAMATAFGGRVIKSPDGWGIGLQRYDVKGSAPWMDGADHVMVPASHQDQVVALPPGASITLANAFTPYAGLDYGDAISFQCHPEFGSDFATALIEMRRAHHGVLADPAIATYAQADDCARVAEWIRKFVDTGADAAVQVA